MAKWSESNFKKYLLDKQRKKESIKISTELFNVLVTLAIKKSSANAIYYLKDLDTFCLKSELEQIANKMELSLKMGTEYNIPTASPLNLCKLNVLYTLDSALSSDRKFAAEKEYEKAQELREEMEKYNKEN